MESPSSQPRGRSRAVTLCTALLILLAGALPVIGLAPRAASASTTARSAALPTDRLHFGLANAPADLGWMSSSGVPWRYRYQYLAGGVNTPGVWTTWQDPALAPGQFALDYMNESRTAGYTPVLTYYELLQSTPSVGSSEAERDMANLNNSATMNAYYANFALLMRRAGQYGGPVIVHVEPDLWGYLQRRAGGGPASALGASVAASGQAEVAGFPNTVAGYAAALLHLRDVYAPQALMAVHASMWSTGQDLASSTDPTLDAAAAAGQTAAFLASTASGWNLVFNDVDDHDAGWWEAQGSNSAGFTHWWDPANRRFPNFSRYLTWVSGLRLHTGLPQVAWQVPLGNQRFLTMNNTCGHYQDNVAEYFTRHAGDLFAAGMVAVLFGSGNACQATNLDGQRDGVTNNGGIPTSDVGGGCSACNTEPSTQADDDGGFIRMAVGQAEAPVVPPPGVRGLYAVDAFGGLRPGSSPALDSTQWGWEIVRGVALRADGSAGYTLDGWGGLHPFGGAPATAVSAYWAGWDISRGMALRSDGMSGYVLDGWGGVHPFGGAPTVQVSAYWSGWDIARGLVLRSDGVSGYVLDGWGGVHPFGGAPTVPVSAYWSGWDISKSLVLGGDGVSGYVLDGWGVLHAFGGAPRVATSAYWPGWDIARGVVAVPGAAARGWVVDGWGGYHPYGGAPDVANGGYRPNEDLVRAATIA